MWHGQIMWIAFGSRSAAVAAAAAAGTAAAADADGLVSDVVCLLVSLFLLTAMKM